MRDTSTAPRTSLHSLGKVDGVTSRHAAKSREHMSLIMFCISRDFSVIVVCVIHSLAALSPEQRTGGRDSTLKNLSQHDFWPM